MTDDSLSAEDIELFRKAMKDVHPLKPDDKIQLAVHTKKIKTATSVQIQASKKSFLIKSERTEYPFSDNIAETVNATDTLFFARAGLQHKLIRDLRRGKIAISATLDLHQMTVPMARKAISYFLEDSLAASHRCVCIIHGKGKLGMQAPVLKNHVNSWLRQHENVLAFCSASARQGGTGAVYVLLRKAVF